MPWGNVIAGFVAVLALVALAISPLLGIRTIRAIGHHEEAVADAAAKHPDQVVRDGELDFVVHSTQCGSPALSGERPDNGSFCVIDVTMHNDGTNPVTLDPNVQLATGSHGAVYPSDGPVEQVVNRGNPAVIPGGSWDEKLVYDVPAGIQLVSVELHGSTYSRGVAVRLQL
ncbi:MAG TPA: DUF4352 domain-containing protein [Micromonosporaceae bacterium]